MLFTKLRFVNYKRGGENRKMTEQIGIGWFPGGFCRKNQMTELSYWAATLTITGFRVN